MEELSRLAAEEVGAEKLVEVEDCMVEESKEC